jgi:hypothetical protein
MEKARPVPKRKARRKANGDERERPMVGARQSSEGPTTVCIDPGFFEDRE